MSRRCVYVTLYRGYKVYRDSETKEYVVRCYDANGVVLPSGDYFTPDLDDAVATANTMQGQPLFKPTFRAPFPRNDRLADGTLVVLVGAHHFCGGTDYRCADGRTVRDIDLQSWMK